MEWGQQRAGYDNAKRKIEEPGSLRSLEAERENLKMIHKADQETMITCFGHWNDDPWGHGYDVLLNFAGTPYMCNLVSK